MKKDLANNKLAQEIDGQNRIQETREILSVIANYMAMPLYMLFWVADIIYVPHLKWEFLILRLCILPLGFTIQYLVKRAKTPDQTQRVALIFNIGMGSAINYMIFRIGDPASGYYAGLNLVALGNLAFIPWNSKYFGIAASIIYLPFFAITAFQISDMNEFYGMFTNSFFIVGTLVILVVTRQFNEALRHRDLSSKLALMDEIQNRQAIIEEKTKEAIALEGLSRQFSPQVLESIRSGSLNISQEVHRSRICAIFIDIVNSTERITRMDKDNVNKVIELFMEDTIKVLLKYDITVDKFLGDGIMAFCNDPVQHADYVQRTVRAALEIKNRIHKRQYIYENYWLNELQIRIGIADGFANVGFYGSEKYFHAYTAIGSVINLANRICASAEPNQIVATYDVIEKIDIDSFNFEFIGKRVLKGFEQDVIKAYEIKSFKHEADSSMSTDTPECPKCSTLMFLDNDDMGIFVFRCRACGNTLKESAASKKAA